MATDPSDLLAMQRPDAIPAPPDRPAGIAPPGVTLTSAPITDTLQPLPPPGPPGAGSPVTPASFVQGPPPPLPVAPPKTTTSSEATHTTSRAILDPAEAKSFATGQEAAGQQAAAATNIGDLKAQQADINAEGERRKAELLQLHGEKLQKIQQDAKAQWDAHMAAYKDAQKAYAEAKPTDLWDGNDGGKRQFFAGVAMALGGLAAAHTGGRNLAYETIKDAIDRHDKQEQARIGRLKERAEMAHGDLGLVLTQKQEATGDLAAWKENALKQAAAEIESRAGMLAGPIAKQDALATAAKLRQDAAVTANQYFNDRKREIHDSVVTRTQEVINAPGTEGGGGRSTVQHQEAMMAVQAKDDLKVIDSGPQLSPTDWGTLQTNIRGLKAAEEEHGVGGATKVAAMRKFGMLPKSPYEGLNKGKEQVAQAWDLLATKAATLISKSSSKEEIEANKAKFLPTSTDSPAAIKQRLQQMRSIVAAAESNAGAIGRRAEAAAGAANGATPRRVRLANGQEGLLYPDGTFEPSAGSAPAAPANKKRAIATQLATLRGQ